MARPKKEETKDFDEVLARIYKCTNTSSFSNLARYLGVVYTSVSGPLKARTIPDGWLDRISKKCKCEYLWLLTGQGDMEAGLDEQKTKLEAVPKSEERELFDQTLHNYLDLILEKGDDDKRFDRIINDIWHLGEKLSNASEKESRIKRAIKKAIGG